mgnify:CR=1 FL=1
MIRGVKKVAELTPMMQQYMQDEKSNIRTASSFIDWETFMKCSLTMR